MHYSTFMSRHAKPTLYCLITDNNIEAIFVICSPKIETQMELIQQKDNSVASTKLMCK
jgi:hypothetical protein